MLSRYTDFTRLGQGGMGVVYRATDTQLHRPVALKFVTAQFGSEVQARARFLREARMAAALNHSAICTIYEVAEVQHGEEGLVGADAPFPSGTPFIAMELIEGKALDMVLRERGRRISRTDAARPSAWDGRVHVAGASAGQTRGLPIGRLLVRRDALRAGRGRAAVPRRHADINASTILITPSPPPTAAIWRSIRQLSTATPGSSRTSEWKRGVSPFLPPIPSPSPSP